MAELIGRGLSNKEIADALGIAIATVKSRLRILYGKAGVDRRAALVKALSAELAAREAMEGEGA